MSDLFISFCRLSLTACILYHIQFRLSSSFQKFFKNFFSDPLDRNLSDLSIISHQDAFVKWFLKSFFEFPQPLAFLRDRCRLSLTAQLLYHTSTPIVNSFFSLFPSSSVVCICYEVEPHHLCITHTHSSQPRPD